MKQFYLVLVCLAIVGLLSGFYQDESWFNYAIILPLGYVAYVFILWTIHAIKNYGNRN